MSETLGDFEWILIDTETTGLRQPIFVIDLAAQRMCGWRPVGEPIQFMVNHGVNIPNEISRKFGYTREILERDGYPPLDVYEHFREYVGHRSICAYNLKFDWDNVLINEWERLGIAEIGTRGFCLYELTRRLVDPVPAGNCKLQTLRQFYRLPERRAHTALGDVLTVVDLIDRVLLPLALDRGLVDQKSIASYLNVEWYPRRLSFGRFKGRDFKDAINDKSLHEWLTWLSASKNPMTKSMGRWYLAQLASVDLDENISAIAVSAIDSQDPAKSVDNTRRGIIVYQNPSLAQLRKVVAAARERLADLEVIYSRDLNKTQVVQARLFVLLKDDYQILDELRLRRDTLEEIVASLFIIEEQLLDQISFDYEYAKEQISREYESASHKAEGVKEFPEEQQGELKELFRKLIRIFHPDRVFYDDDKKKSYTVITQLIIEARDAGDLASLREIADDYRGYLSKHGLSIDEAAGEDTEDQLSRIYMSLQSRIIEIIDKIDSLRLTKDYELAVLCARRPNHIIEVASKRRVDLVEECSRLRGEIAALTEEIFQATGEYPPLGGTD